MGVRETARGALLALTALCVPYAADGASFTVDDPAEAGDVDTNDPACATAGGACTLRAAIEQANALPGPHTITLPAGTWVQSATLPAIVEDVTIAGAGAATTVIRASDAGRPRLFEVPAGALRLSGIRLANAAAGPGSAIRATGGAVVLDASVVEGNAGGAVLGEAGSPLAVPARISVLGTAFTGNTGGSALEAGDSYELHVDGGTFDRNDATPSFGGAVAITGTGTGRTQTIVASAFTGNTAGGGGALFVVNFSGTIAIADTTFAGNSTGAAVGNGGGAILSFEPDLTITNTTFAGNLATGPSQNGGAILSPQIAFRCTGCAFHDNATTLTGGAICATGMIILNSTFTANTAGTSGGAIYVDNPALPNALSLGNATIVGNTASAGGGLRGGSASVIVKSSIIAANTAPTGADCVGTVGSQGWNVVGRDSSCDFASVTGDQVGTAATPIAPVVGPLAFHGGTTATMPLEPGSPAIDRGDPAGCGDFAAPPIALATDQRGAPRVTDGDGDGTALCDVGAFERDAGPFSTSTTGVSTTSTSSTSASTTTLPAPVCTGGAAIAKAALVVRRGTALRWSGTLDLPAGRPASFDPSETGAQVLIEDLGRGAVVFELSHRTTPIPGGRGCDDRDGWKRTRYVNRSGRIDPPACTAGSANGLRQLRFKDRRRKGRGIGFLVTTKGSSLGTLVGPFRGTIVLGSSIVASAVGDCGSLAFAAGACSTRRTTLRCR